MARDGIIIGFGNFTLRVIRIAFDGGLEIHFMADATWHFCRFLRSALKCTGDINTIRWPLPCFTALPLLCYATQGQTSIVRLAKLQPIHCGIALAAASDG